MTMGGAIGRLGQWPPLARPFGALDRALRRRGWANVVLALAVLIPLLSNALLLAGYLNAANHRNSLGAQVQEAERSLDEQVKAQQSAPSPTAVPGRAAPAVPDDLESADIVDLFLKLAQESAVEVVAVDDDGVTVQRLGSRDYRAFRYNVQLHARVSQLVAFLNRLETSQQNVLGVEKLTANPVGGQNWSITIGIVTYALAKGT